MRSRTIIFPIIACCVLSAFSRAGAADSSPDRRIEFSRLLETARSKAGTRSISAALILHDGTVITAAANRHGAGNPVTPDTRFSIGSCTKTFIAACVFKLIELHKLSLDDTIQKLLYGPGILAGSYKDKIDPRIRVRDLLGHRTGLDDYLGVSYYQAIYAKPDRLWDRAMTLSHVGSPVYAYDHVSPGNNAFRYSNTNYILLGMIVEGVSGKKVSDLLTGIYLAPLGLTSTYLAGAEPYRGLKSIPGDMAVGYEKVLGSWIKSSTYVGRDAVAVYSSTWTCGSMISTARDMARWARYYYNLQRTGGYCTDAMLSPGRISSRYFTEKKFGYGIERVRHRDGLELWGHTGTIIGFNCMVFYIPAKDISVAVLINEHHPNRWAIMSTIIEYINTFR